jgi:hemoglobin/transferrin/lactoferrin receptor protein
MSYRPHGASVSARAFISPWYLVGISVAALLCAIPQPVAAQELTEAQTTILKRITFIAQRKAKSVLDVPATVTVIDGETLEKRMIRDIQDLVRLEPGVQVDRSSSATQPWAQLGGFTIRGVSGNRVQMQVDGSRTIESIIDGGRDVIDPWNMKQVEIVKGPAGVLWGADALGGVVSFQTLDPEDLLDDSEKPWAVEIKTAFDSYDRSFRQQINAAYDFGNGLKVLGSLGHVTSHEARLSNARADGGIWGCARAPNWSCDKFFPTDAEAYNAMAKAVWTPNADHRVEVTAEWNSRKTDVYQVDTSANAVSGTPTTTSQYNVDEWTRSVIVERPRLAIEHEWQINNGFIDSLKWDLSYSPQRRGTDSFKKQSYALPVSYYTTNHAVRDYREAFLEAEIQAISSFELGASSHTLTYGFDGDIANTLYDDYTDTYNSRTGVSGHTEYNGFSFPDVETVRADLYVQDEIKLFDEKLTITPGLRYATYSIDPTKGKAPSYLPGFKPEKIDSQTLIKSLSAKYQFTDAISAYVAYNEGYKMPTSQQLFVSSLDPFSGGEVIPNPNLRPETVKSYEVGVRGEFEKGWISATAFHSDYTDFIQRLQEVAPDTYTSINLSKVKLSGIELASEFEIYENLFFNTAVTYQYGRQQASPTAAEGWYEPATPLTAVLGLRYELPENDLEFEVFGTFAAGPEHRNNPDAFKPDGYAIFDAFTKWKPTEDIEITAGIQNIFDTRYFPNTLNGYNMPGIPGGTNAGNAPPELQTGPGRTFKVGASVKF